MLSSFVQIEGQESTFESGECMYILKLAESQKREIIQILEERDANNASSRAHPRHLYCVANGVQVQIAQPGGSVTRFIVAPRNLSTNGMQFLHGGYVHVGTSCIANLLQLNGHTQLVRGTVVRCDYICGRVHDIGIKFDSSIPIQEFVKCAEAEAGEESAEPAGQA